MLTEVAMSLMVAEAICTDLAGRGLPVDRLTKQVRRCPLVPACELVTAI